MREYGQKMYENCKSTQTEWKGFFTNKIYKYLFNETLFKFFIYLSETNFSIEIISEEVFDIVASFQL